MNDTISCDISNYVVEPLNGEFSDVSLDYEVKSPQNQYDL